MVLSSRPYDEEDIARAIEFAEAALGVAGHRVSGEARAFIGVDLREDLTDEQAVTAATRGFASSPEARVSSFRRWEDYEDAQGVLRNRLGLATKAELRIAEEFLTARRVAQLCLEPLPGEFDLMHLRAVHRHIFQDVYEWAGRIRVGPSSGFMTKDGHPYAPYAFLTESLETEFMVLGQMGHLSGRAPDQFAVDLANRWSAVNAAHAFREGNTRSQFAFFSQLANAAGYVLRAELFVPGAPLCERFISTRREADWGSERGFAEVLRAGLRPLDA